MGRAFRCIFFYQPFECLRVFRKRMPLQSLTQGLIPTYHVIAKEELPVLSLSKRMKQSFASGHKPETDCRARSSLAITDALQEFVVGRLPPNAVH